VSSRIDFYHEWRSLLPRSRILEAAPLLVGSEDGRDGDTSHYSYPSLTERITSVVQEPLTNLTKILLVVVLALLLFSSVFIGLYAGAQYNLNLEKGRNHDGNNGEPQPPETVTITYIETTTSISTTTSTSISSPVPTHPTKEVHHSLFYQFC
jgi:endothelin-converting enzyme